MNSKERVLKSLAHEEPDRVPLFELAFSAKLAGEILGREAFFPRNGGFTLKKILEANASGRKERKAAVREGTQTQIEVYTKLGYDIIFFIPTEFCQVVSECFGLFGNNFLFDVSIKEIETNCWKVTGPESFWSVHRYDEQSDVFYAVDDAVIAGGMPALRRYVEVLESRSKEMNEYTLDALESIRIAVESKPARSGDLFVLGHCDVCMPTADAFLPLFLEAMALEPELVDRYFETTTEGLLPILEAQLEMGVDGIAAANDWCFKSGPMMSPAMFRRFLVPHLKTFADETHKRGRPFVKHLDGNTEALLPMLIDEVGIDAYHAIEPAANMDIAKLKKQYGHKISLWGNVDCGELLTNGTPEQIRRSVKEITRVAAPGGGFVLASSNAIHNAIPMENLQAMLEAARDYGRYPIQV